MLTVIVERLLVHVPHDLVQELQVVPVNRSVAVVQELVRMPLLADTQREHYIHKQKAVDNMHTKLHM
jgi:hypothetical protein